MPVTATRSAGSDLTEIADGVFAWLPDVDRRFTCNVGILVEDDGLTLIDAGGLGADGDRLESALGRFARPVTRVVLTHGHGDHVGAAGRFAGAAVLCSDSCAAALAAEPAIPALQALHPEIATDLAGLTHPQPGEIVCDSRPLGSRAVLELLAGHTGGDIVVRVPDADTVFAGDLCFFGHVPLGIGADFPRWQASLGRLRGLETGYVVPGHGPLGGRTELDQVAAYLEAVVTAAATDGQVADGPWREWWDPWGHRVAGASHRINVEQARLPDAFPATLIDLVSGS